LSLWVLENPSRGKRREGGESRKEKRERLKRLRLSEPCFSDKLA
jgi:hypothetical protein